MEVPLPLGQALWLAEPLYGRLCKQKTNSLVLTQNRSTAPAALNVASTQARSYAAEAKASPTEVSSILEQRIRGVQEEAGLAETGRVLSVGYAIIQIFEMLGRKELNLTGFAL